MSKKTNLVAVICIKNKVDCKTTYGDDVWSRDDEQLLKRTCQEEPTKGEIKDGNILFKPVYCPPKPVNYMIG